MSPSDSESGERPKTVRLERWDESGDLAIPLPDYLIERHNLKDGDTLDIKQFIPLLKELGRRSPCKSRSGT